MCLWLNLMEQNRQPQPSYPIESITTPVPVPDRKFPYPALPLGVDALRILTLEPGDFYDPLIGTLIPVTFESKPKYVALSYTWSDSYPDNARLPTSPHATDFPHADQRLASILPKGLSKVSLGIPRSGEPAALTLNGRPCHLGHNLHLALLHLRSFTSPLTLWVDAICINQANMEERNGQVALMSFIFMRAMKVVAWLGTKDYGNHLDPFQCMSIDSKAGQAPHFAASLVGATKMRCSVAPDRNTLARITESSYWTRMWIVQEICLPRLLVFIYGANVWAYEDFRQCDAFNAVRSGPPHPNSATPTVMNDGFKPMLKLFAARDTRNTGSMRLESLMEQFAASGCAELRDRVYGLMGLADNIRPVTRTNNEVHLIEKYTNPLDSQFHTLLEPKEGLGLIPVDYSRSFYDIWTDVVISVYIRAEGIEEETRNRPIDAASGLDDWTSISLTHEGHQSVVRIAGIVQEALDQMVEKDVVSLELYNASPPHSAKFTTDET
jgi:Heterokaryon incompatibility protein (HET)